MPVPIPDAVAAQADAAATKAVQVRSLPRYLALAALAGAYVGIAVVVLVSVSAPLVAAGSPAAKLVQAAVFGIALTLVVFAGAELFTGNAMVMLQGLRRGHVSGRDLGAVWIASLAGNIAGSVLLAAVVHAGGTLSGTGSELVGKIVDTKAALAGPQLFWRSVLCNLLVCLGLWMAQRTRSDAAKLVVLWWALLAFIGSGFEHSVANMTIFGLGVFEGVADWADLVRNLAWTVPGNIVGGGMLVGLAYAWLGRPAQPVTAAPEPIPEPAVDAPLADLVRQGAEAR